MSGCAGAGKECVTAQGHARTFLDRRSLASGVEEEENIPPHDCHSASGATKTVL